jgi:hypothetical protein
VKKLFAILFVFVLLFSVLPVREIGKLLGKQQTTEEVHNDDMPAGDDDFGGKIKKEIDPFLVFEMHEQSDILNSYNNKVLVAIHGASILPDHYIPRIPTPPPNIG